MKKVGILLLLVLVGLGVGAAERASAEGVFPKRTARMHGAPQGVTFTVNSTLDEPDKLPGDGKCKSKPSKVCTLRAAIMENNATGGNTILLPAGTYKLTHSGANEDNAATGDLDILQNVNLKGAKAAITIIDGQALDRVLDVQGGKAKIRNLTVQNGKAPTWGGGILIAQGATATLTKIRVSLNAAGTTGGGIENRGILKLNKSAIEVNQDRGAGGGINNGGLLEITKSSIVGNTSTIGAGYGGGIYNEGTLGIEESTIAVNTGNQGGAIRSSGMLVLVNSTVANNTANTEGGALYVTGGGVYLYYTTIAENNAPSNSGAGGIYNSAGTVYMLGSLLDENRAGVVGDDCQGTLHSNGYNLVFGVSGCTINPDVTDVIGISSGLGALGNNGGPTQTMALPDGSAAIDQIPANKCVDGSSNPVTHDQRGKPRPADGDGNGKVRCDMGAFEVEP